MAIPVNVYMTIAIFHFYTKYIVIVFNPLQLLKIKAQDITIIIIFVPLK